MIMSPRKLIGVRDPYGLKPLCIGKRDHTYVLASESCALNSVGAEFVRDVEPGEMVIISRGGYDPTVSLPEKKLHIVYLNIFTLPGLTAFWTELEFMMPVSGVENLLQGPIRWRRMWLPAFRIPAFRRQKATQRNLEFPLVLPAHKNSYIGRTFIKPTQKERESSVHMKLSVLESAVKGKRIVLVDDSIVRGTTIANLIHMLKKAGAREVHGNLVSAFSSSCYFGTDVPSNDQLIASIHSTEEICRMIGADSLGYMKLEYLEGMAGGLPLCRACFDGNYPMEDPIRANRSF